MPPGSRFLKAKEQQRSNASNLEGRGMTHRYCKPAVGALGFAAALMLVSAGGAPAQQPATPAAPIKLGIVSFLSGPAASPFGVPGRNGAEIVIEAINAGSAPAP
jgi:hypothetical protein